MSSGASEGTDAESVDAPVVTMSNTKAEIVDAGVVAGVGSTEEVEAMTKAEIIAAIGEG